MSRALNECIYTATNFLKFQFFLFFFKIADFAENRVPLSYVIEFRESSRRPGPGPHMMLTRCQVSGRIYPPGDY